MNFETQTKCFELELAIESFNNLDLDLSYQEKIVDQLRRNTDELTLEAYGILHVKFLDKFNLKQKSSGFEYYKNQLSFEGIMESIKKAGEALMKFLNYIADMVLDIFNSLFNEVKKLENKMMDIGKKVFALNNGVQPSDFTFKNTSISDNVKNNKEEVDLDKIYSSNIIFSALLRYHAATLQANTALLIKNTNADVPEELNDLRNLLDVLTTVYENHLQKTNNFGEWESVKDVYMSKTIFAGNKRLCLFKEPLDGFDAKIISTCNFVDVPINEAHKTSVLKTLNLADLKKAITVIDGLLVKILPDFKNIEKQFQTFNRLTKKNTFGNIYRDAKNSLKEGVSRNRETSDKWLKAAFAAIKKTASFSSSLCSKSIKYFITTARYLLKYVEESLKFYK